MTIEEYSKFYDELMEFLNTHGLEGHIEGSDYHNDVFNLSILPKKDTNRQKRFNDKF